MSDTSTPVRAWTRWQDWAEVVLGVVAVLSPLWLDTTNTVTWTMIVLGALIAVDGLFSLAMPGVVYGEYVQVALGALLFISPWVMGFTDMNGAMWSSFVIGALTLVVGLSALPAAATAHRGMAGQH